VSNRITVCIWIESSVAIAVRFWLVVLFVAVCQLGGLDWYQWENGGKTGEELKAEGK
jgi:hypothetical protein